MQIRWGKELNDSSRGVPMEDTPVAMDGERKFATAIDEIVAEHRRQGGFDNLEGKGKPLELSEELQQDYYLNKVLKNANILPDWLELQHHIRKRLALLLKHPLADQNRLQKELDEINDEIRKYNRKCPNPLLYKPLVRPDNLEEQLNLWQ